MTLRDKMLEIGVMNRLEENNYNVLITLLDYQSPVSRCLKSIKIYPRNVKKVLIDTVLCTGLNEYRFIEATLNNDGTINLNEYKYVNIEKNLEQKANEIIKNQPLYLKNSILPESISVCIVLQYVLAPDILFLDKVRH